MADGYKQIIDKKREQIELYAQVLDEMVKDPEWRSAMRLALAAYDNKDGKPRRSPTRTSLKQKKQNKAIAKRGAIFVTGLTEAVKKALNTVPEQFKVHDVLDQMAKHGYQFHTAEKYRRIGVTKILQRMTGKEIELVSKGTGGEPSVYRRVK